nr:putative baseplate assembly protein [Acidobacteriota bacterium]
ERWDIRRVAEVAADADSQRTFVRWAEPLGSVVPHVDPAQKKVSVYAMRLRASLFGYNAPDWKALPVALRVGELSPQDRSFLPGAYAGRENTWAGHNFDPMKPGTNTATINLDSTYPQIVLNSWIALARPEADVPSETKATPEPTAGAPAQPSVAHVDSAQAETGVNAPTEAAAAGAPPPPPPPSPPTVHEHAYAELYRVRKVGEESKADYNITAKTTRLEISGENIEKFSPRNATVYAQSDKLPMAETPIADPVFGDQIVLEGLFEPPAPGRRIVVAGRRAHAVVGTTTSKLKLVSPDDSTLYKPLNAGDELIVLSPPASSPLPPPASAAPGSQQGATLLRWRLMDESGFEGFVDAHADKITFAASSKDDAVISEVASVRATGSEDDTHTKLFLAAALGNVFDRPTVRINANVALATHGETVSNEVLGNGDASKPYQSFVLKQSPLTYVASDAPSGGDSTLQVFANGIRWHEVPTLFNHGRRERIYITRTDEDINTHEKKTTVQFGDGETGARLPMGRENVRATYRKGIGLGGLVGAGKLSLLLTRPLGLKAVTNPQAASGAQDPQSLSDARVNSPLTVLTLDRIVSLSDYEDFARSFSGIAKALATWTWNVHTRGVFVTVAGITGAAVADDSDLHAKLLSAIYKAGDPQVPIQIKSYHGVTFRLVADVKVDADYVAADVLAAVEAALRASFSFAARAFGQPVTLSEVISVMKNVAGVVAVDVRRLNRSDAAEALNSFLAAAAPQAGDDASQARPAELLTLDPVPLELGVMP